MAIIHKTTLEPGKLALLTSWLPRQPWYRGTTPDLAKAGGFRLDDPDGEVGIEFCFVVDSSGSAPIVYHAPLTFRGAPLPGADAALIGESEHGVLGRRWVYDAEVDPVALEQMRALFRGGAEPQQQSVSNAADATVVVHGATRGDDPHPRAVRVLADGAAGSHGVVAAEGKAWVEASWRVSEMSSGRGPVLIAG